MKEYMCIRCGSVGPYLKFDDHVVECLRGAPEAKPGESFDSWSARVEEWRRERQVQNDKGV